MIVARNQLLGAVVTIFQSRFQSRWSLLWSGIDLFLRTLYDGEDIMATNWSITATSGVQILLAERYADGVLLWSRSSHVTRLSDHFYNNSLKKLTEMHEDKISMPSRTIVNWHAYKWIRLMSVLKNKTSFFCIWTKKQNMTPCCIQCFKCKNQAQLLHTHHKHQNYALFQHGFPARPLRWRHSLHYRKCFHNDEFEMSILSTRRERMFTPTSVSDS